MPPPNSCAPEQPPLAKSRWAGGEDAGGAGVADSLFCIALVTGCRRLRINGAKDQRVAAHCPGGSKTLQGGRTLCAPHGRGASCGPIVANWKGAGAELRLGTMVSTCARIASQVLATPMPLLDSESDRLNDFNCLVVACSYHHIPKQCHRRPSSLLTAKCPKHAHPATISRGKGFHDPDKVSHSECSSQISL